MDGVTDTLSLREKETLRVITAFIQEHGYPPSVRDVQARVGLGSISSTHYLLVRLQQKGKIQWDRKHSRTIRVLKD
jgi:repressor LexA